MTPKLLVNIIRLIDITLESVILNTKIEANVILYDLTKYLRYLILSIENLKLKTVSS